MTGVLAVVFDLDGVVRTWRNVGSQLAESTHQLPPGTIARLAYDGQFDLAHHGLLTHDEWVAGVRDRLIAECGPAAGSAVDRWISDRGDVDHAVVNLVRLVRASGRRVAGLTNNTSVLDRDLALHELADVFDVVVNSADIGVTKPSPIAFRITAAHLGLPLSAIGFVDNDPINVQAATQLGMAAHHYINPDALSGWLADLGVDLTDETPGPLPTRSEERNPGHLVDHVLSFVGKPVAPLDGAAESGRHSQVLVRYVASALSADALARFLSDHPKVTAAVADNGIVGVILTDTSIAEIRLLPTNLDPRLAVSDPAAGLPVGAEHLRAWTPETRQVAQAAVSDAMARCAWNLTQIAAAHHHRDYIAAAAAVDRARTAAVAVVSTLARRHPGPVAGVHISRYLGSGTRTRLTESWRTIPTTPDGLADVTAAIVEVVRRARYTCRHVLDCDPRWPWDQLATTLRPLLNDRADLTPRVPDDDALYHAELAAVYDQHRPVTPEMAAGLRNLAHQWLAGAVVVELGAGTGRITAHLADQATTYMAAEFAPDMVTRLLARDIPNAVIVHGDAHDLDLDDNSVDVVVEHEALTFTEDPTRVLKEVERVLRPGGLLIRILVHPIHGDPATLVEAAYCKAAFAGAPGPLIIGKGTDSRLTATLADRGWTTHEHTLATWERQRSVTDVLAPLADKAWPYLWQATPELHTAGLDAARHIAIQLANPGRVLRSTHRLYALVTSFGDLP